MKEGGYNLERAREMPQIKTNVRLVEYGTPRSTKPRPLREYPSITLQKQGVVVSGEYVTPGSSQAMPLQRTWRDTMRDDSVLLDRAFTYNELPNGMLVLAGIQEQESRTEGLQRRALGRQFDAQGQLQEDVLLVDSAVRSKRRYRSDRTGAFVMEEEFTEAGALWRRRNYSRGLRGDEWSVHTTTFGRDGKEAGHDGSPVLAIPPFNSLTSEYPFVPTASLPVPGAYKERVPDWTMNTVDDM